MSAPSLPAEFDPNALSTHSTPSRTRGAGDEEAPNTSFAHATPTHDSSSTYNPLHFKMEYLNPVVAAKFAMTGVMGAAGKGMELAGKGVANAKVTAGFLKNIFTVDADDVAFGPMNPDEAVKPLEKAKEVIETEIKIIKPPVRTLFGATWKRGPDGRRVFDVNDEVRLTVWCVGIVAALCAAGFLIADLALGKITVAMARSDLHGIAVIVGGVFSILASALSFIQIRQHYRHWSHPPSQRLVVRILLMVPFYASSAWLSLTFLKLNVYFDFVRTCYEAFVIYTFMILLTKYLGGHSGVVEWMMYKPKLPWPQPFCCLPKLEPGNRFLYWLKYGTLQYAIITPFLYLMAIVMNMFDVYGDGDISPDRGFFWITLIQNISQVLALYCLVWLYVTMKNELAPFGPVPKFLVVKSVVFFTFWQGVGLAVLVQMGIIEETAEYSVGEIQVGLQDFIVCFEMFLAAAAHKYTFGCETYANGSMKLLMEQRALYLAEQHYKRAKAKMDQQLKEAEEEMERLEAMGAGVHGAGILRAASKKKKAALPPLEGHNSALHRLLKLKAAAILKEIDNEDDEGEIFFDEDLADDAPAMFTDSPATRGAKRRDSDIATLRAQTAIPTFSGDIYSVDVHHNFHQEMSYIMHGGRGVIQSVESNEGKSIAELYGQRGEKFPQLKPNRAPQVTRDGYAQFTDEQQQSPLESEQQEDDDDSIAVEMERIDDNIHSADALTLQSGTQHAKAPHSQPPPTHLTPTADVHDSATGDIYDDPSQSPSHHYDDEELV